MSKPEGTVGKSALKDFEHKILGDQVTDHKSPEQACLLQGSLYLKEHQEIKYPCLLKLWVEWFFVLVRMVGFCCLICLLWQGTLFGVFICLVLILLGSFMSFPLNLLKILRNKGNSRTDDESDQRLRKTHMRGDY